MICISEKFYDGIFIFFITIKVVYNNNNNNNDDDSNKKLLQ